MCIHDTKFGIELIFLAEDKIMTSFEKFLKKVSNTTNVLDSITYTDTFSQDQFLDFITNFVEIGESFGEASIRYAKIHNPELTIIIPNGDSPNQPSAISD